MKWMVLTHHILKAMLRRWNPATSQFFISVTILPSCFRFLVYDLVNGIHHLQHYIAHFNHLNYKEMIAYPSDQTNVTSSHIKSRRDRHGHGHHASGAARRTGPQQTRVSKP